MASVSSSSQSKSIPKDSLVIISILKDMGITDYEPKVVHQLLEFTYRYVTTVLGKNILFCCYTKFTTFCFFIKNLLYFSASFCSFALLDDAQIFSVYAKKKNIDADDVKLAIQLQVERMFTSPPPRDLLLEIARHKNNQPLPPIKSHAGPRLPPDRYSLIGCNYRLKNTAKLKNSQDTQSTSSGGSQQITLPFRALQTGTATTLLTNVTTNRSPSVITLPGKSSAASTNIVISNNRIANNSNVTEIKSFSQINEESQSFGVKRKLSESG